MENKLTLQNTQNNLDLQVVNKCGIKIIQVLLLASDRMGVEIKNIENVALDVYDSFKHVKIQEIEIAIKNGSLGKYGIQYKLTSHIICFWIYQYLKEKNHKNIEI
jgi:hypothetical protein